MCVFASTLLIIIKVCVNYLLKYAEKIWAKTLRCYHHWAWPRKRSKVQSDNQRHYLNNLGTYHQTLLHIRQTVLSRRIESDVSIALDIKSSYFWNIAQNAAFVLFVVSFMKILGEKKHKMFGMRVVNTGHKMKSAGEKKDGKVVQHFSSHCHWICQFRMILIHYSTGANANRFS